MKITKEMYDEILFLSLEKFKNLEKEITKAIKDDDFLVKQGFIRGAIVKFLTTTKYVKKSKREIIGHDIFKRLLIDIKMLEDETNDKELEFEFEIELNKLNKNAVAKLFENLTLLIFATEKNVEQTLFNNELEFVKLSKKEIKQIKILLSMLYIEYDSMLQENGFEYYVEFSNSISDAINTAIDEFTDNNIKKEIPTDYLIKTDLTSLTLVEALNLLDDKIYEYNDVLEGKDNKENAEYILKNFNELLTMTKDDIFTQIYFNKLLTDENKAVAEKMPSDIEDFIIFIYEQDDEIRYFIPKEIKDIIKKEIPKVKI